MQIHLSGGSPPRASYAPGQDPRFDPGGAIAAGLKQGASEAWHDIKSAVIGSAVSTAGRAGYDHYIKETDVSLKSSGKAAVVGAVISVAKDFWHGFSQGFSSHAYPGYN